MDLNKLTDTQGLTLSRGWHTKGDGTCVMEAVAWLAGEDHSGSPLCTAKCIARIMIKWNDRLPSDAERAKWLGPLIVHIVGTNHPELDRQRAYICADYAVRKIAPIALRVRGREKDAVKLEQLPAIVDKETALAGKKAADAYADADAYAAYASDSAADAAAYASAAADADDAYAAAYASAAASASAAAADVAAADALNIVLTNLVMDLCMASKGKNMARDMLISKSEKLSINAVV